MKKSHYLPDIGQRLRLFELRLNYSKNENWLSILGYSNEGAISKIKNGKQGITDAAIDRICATCGIKRSDFFMPPIELAGVLGISGDGQAAEVLASIAASSSDLSQELHAADRYLLDKLPGSYILIYPGREEMKINRSHIVIERLEITLDGGKQKGRVVQLSNYVSGERAEGYVSTRGSTIHINLSYKKSYYPDSTFLMQPIAIDGSLNVLSGIYLDVGPLAHIEIFATQCCIFSVPDEIKFPRTYPMEHELFEPWMDILSNGKNERGRLKHGAGPEFYERVRIAALKSIENGRH